MMLWKVTIARKEILLKKMKSGILYLTKNIPLPASSCLVTFFHSESDWIDILSERGDFNN